MKRRKFLLINSLFSGPRIIAAGFLFTILLGSVLLKLPFATTSGISYYDALFVSATSVCVTGLTTVNIGTCFTTAGHVIILFLIQLGGLGFVTFSTIILLLLGKRLTLRNRLLIRNAYNVDTMKGLGEITLGILKTTFIFEGLGAIGYACVFIPLYGVKGLWYAIFHSVSAFCNAGIDLLGGDSFTGLRYSITANLITIILIICSGIGFPVYREIADIIRRKQGKIKGGEKASVYIKTVFAVTAFLILFGMTVTLLCEWKNPETLGSVGTGQKILDSVFQSVTLRTAGFQTIPQGSFRGCTCLIYMILMFIGGSPCGTAGGVKTVTVTVALASLICNIRGNKNTTVMGRKISDETVRQANTIISFSFCVLCIGTFLLLLLEDCSFIDAAYEMTSAIATVGLTRGITSDLGTAAKLVVTATMYLGRIGPITLALSFNGKAPQPKIERCEAKMTVG